MVKDIGLLGNVCPGSPVWELSKGVASGPNRLGVEVSLAPVPGTNYVWVNFKFDKNQWVAPRVGKTIMVLLERIERNPMKVRLELFKENDQEFDMGCRINEGTVYYWIRALPGLVPTRSEGKIRRRRNRKALKQIGPWDHRRMY